MSTMYVLLRFLIFALILLAVLFVPAGRLDLPFFWAYATIMVTYAVIVGFFVMDAELREERIRPKPGQDRVLRRIASPFTMAHLIIAGLDARHQFSDTVPVWARIAGLAGLIVALSFVGWAVSYNRFFSPVVRIQAERGHHLVTGGPYGLIRHPGYIGAVVMIVSSGFALGSWWAMAPLIVPLVLILRRAALEDRFLHRELEGYPDYAKRVRYRLLPGVW